jgi:hypothetical protein
MAAIAAACSSRMLQYKGATRVQKAPRSSRGHLAHDIQPFAVEGVLRSKAPPDHAGWHRSEYTEDSR